jgi:NADPH:quinone reductase
VEVMRAAVFTGAAHPGLVAVQNVARPTPKRGEVLVRVRATALNRADLLQRDGRYPSPPGAPSDIAGLEFAGEVVEVAEGVRGARPGDRVFGITAGGAHAEYLAIPAVLLAPIPVGVTWTQAAAIPEACITAHDALITQAAASAGERVLIFAVGSGVGTAAVQIARGMGLRPYGITRTTDKLDGARQLGLEDGAALSRPDALPETVSAWTRGEGMDVVLDLAGGDWTAAGVASLAPQGRLMLIGLVAGRRAELDLAAILSRRLTIRGTVLRPRSVQEKAEATAAFARDVLPLIERGSVRAVIDSTFPLERVAEAYERMASNASFGKIVLEL